MMIKDFSRQPFYFLHKFIFNTSQEISRDMYSLTVWGDKGPVHHSLSSWVGEGGSIESSGPCIKISEPEAIGEVSIT